MPSSLAILSIVVSSDLPPYSRNNRIALRSRKIDNLAESCGLSTAEYFRKIALGYVPKPAISDAFYVFNERLCELLNRELSPETEAAALKLFDDVYAEIIDTPKQSKKEIIREVAEWQAPDSGLSSPD